MSCNHTRQTPHSIRHLCPCRPCRRLGHDTAHFNVGNYRRKQKGADEVQDAAFFDSHNPVSGDTTATALAAAAGAVGEEQRQHHKEQLEQEQSSRSSTQQPP